MVVDKDGGGVDEQERYVRAVAMGFLDFVRDVCAWFVDVFDFWYWKVAKVEFGGEGRERSGEWERVVAVERGKRVATAEWGEREGEGERACVKEMIFIVDHIFCNLFFNKTVYFFECICLFTILIICRVLKNGEDVGKFVFAFSLN